MKTFFFDSSQGHSNWGKFMLGQFEAEEWFRPTALPAAEGEPMLFGRGWRPGHLLFVDLQTGEGAILMPGKGCSARADLAKHKVWVCPMAEPFLEWLYEQDLSDLSMLPRYVELPNAPFEMSGYRRAGERPE